MTATSLPKRIAQQLMTMIQLGELKPGAHLSVPKLAEQFSVSRSPVRQAMLLLQSQRVLQQQANRGFFVAEGHAVANRENLTQPTTEIAELPAAYYQLAEDWLQDKIEAEVSEQALLRRYELSKSQLQQVLVHGVSDGWIERKPGYGWRLLPVAKTEDALTQLFRFRMTIESQALLEPTFFAPTASLQALRALMQNMLDGGIEQLSPHQLQRNGYLFHETVIGFANNPFFEHALRTVNRQRRLLDYRVMCDRAHFYHEVRDHLALLDLIEQGELDAASALMKNHLQHAVIVKNISPSSNH